MSNGPRREYKPLVVRCRDCREPHATTRMTRMEGSYVCDKCAPSYFKTAWERKL